MLVSPAPETVDAAREMARLSAPTNQVALVCPETKLPLRETSLEEAEILVGGGKPLLPRLNDAPPPVGPTARVLVSADHSRAYPILDGIPMLLGPEALTSADRARSVDLSDPRYEEAYLEMEHYNAAALATASDIASCDAVRYLEPLRGLSDTARTPFPEPRSLWLHAGYDAPAEWDAFRHLRPLEGKRVLQLGGTGLHAVKFLLAGSREAWIVSPMVGELVLTQKIAQYFGVDDRLKCVAGVGEAIPVADASFDAVYSGGCLHHMRTEQALPEIARILAPGGRFSAVDPWRAPLYALGTKIFGQRETRLVGKRSVGVYCRPMSAERVKPLFSSFESASVTQHGTLTRYPMLGLWKLGIRPPQAVIWRINAVDDRLCSFIPGLRSKGSSVAVLGSRSKRS